MKFSYSAGSSWSVLLLFCLILSVYVVYQQVTDSDAVDMKRHLERHERMLEGKSEFFNPWQYRIFSTYVAEGFYQVVHRIINRMGKAESFIFLRILQNLLIFLMAELYFRSIGIQNPWLRLTGQLILGFCMSHSTFQSDLSFNTYFDILFYLLAAWLILQKKYNWLIPVTCVAALNRETAALIPALLVVPFINWKDKKIPTSILKTGVGMVIIFVIVFVSVRLYYGYQPAKGIHGMNSLKDYLIFNLTFIRMYLELIGTLAFLPILVILFLKRLPLLLQQWFWVVCPVWFIVHLGYSTAVETRLFLLPQALIFIPAFLILVEKWYTEKTSEVVTTKNL